MSLSLELTPTLLIAVYGALLSTLVFGWNMYRDLSDKGRLKVLAGLRDIYGPTDVHGGYGKVAEDQVSIRITNVGKRPVFVYPHTQQIAGCSICYNHGRFC